MIRLGPTSSTLLLSAQIELRAGRYTSLQPTLHRVFLVYPLRFRLAPRGLIRHVMRRAQLSKVVHALNSPHLVLRTPGVLSTPPTGRVLELQKNIAGRGTADVALSAVQRLSWVGDGCDLTLER